MSFFEMQFFVRRCVMYRLALGLVVIAFSSSISLDDSVATADDGMDFFESKVRPVLVEHCYSCHSVEAAESNGELNVDSGPALIRGGTRGPAIVKGSPDQSALIRAVNYSDSDMQMPPDGKLSDDKIADLRRWIEMGAPDPRVETKSVTPEEAKASLLAKKKDLAQSHWAYQRLKRLGEPDAAASSDPWVRDPIDAWVLMKLKEKQLSHSPDAERRTLVRRAHYDLTGLPPSWKQMDTAVNNSSSDWYEQLVDELIDSPAFGERMARRWMDVARYADNKGYVFEENREYPDAYRYRDWLIRSFNDDLTYVDFIKYQLVADRLDPQNANGHLNAMGMLTLGRRFLQNQNDIADDRIDVVTRGFLGVTAACARCHDHKFDAVSQADYYSLHGAFVGSQEPGGEPSPLRLVDREQQDETFVYLRGQPGNRGPKIERKFFEFLEGDKPRPLSTGSGRFELAESIAAPDNPLTARVYVNRVWGWIFGSPIVDTPSDFGLRCEPPIHQAVLDDLSLKFIEEGWSTKQLVRRIVLSSTYRQSSMANPRSIQVDPENRYFWRANRKRADFESYRDSMLLVAGILDPAVGGKSEIIHAAPFSKRRTVYAYIDRQNLPQLFRTFDFASPDAHVPQRAQTTVPQQGLVLLNSDMMRQFVQPLADEALRIGKAEASTGGKVKGIATSIRWLYRQILAREPSTQEVELMSMFVDKTDTSLPPTLQNVWSYGYGSVNPKTGRVIAFHPFSEVHDHAWRTSAEFPDPKTGWVTLNAAGGHPGKSAGWSTIRRWTAPKKGIVEINGQINRPAIEGDGVRGRLVVGAQKQIQTWAVPTGTVPARVERLDVEAGESVDFIVDCVDNENSDSYSWQVTIRYQGESTDYDSKRDYSEAIPARDTVWHQIAQALLMTNEFCFVD